MIETSPEVVRPVVLTVLISKSPLLVSDTEPVLPASCWIVLLVLFRV